MTRRDRYTRLRTSGKYVRMGADFQCIAAKYMGAPQSTGLALGTEDFIRKLGYQSFVGYEGRRIRGIGRPHKVDRQEMIGAVAAVQRWFTMDHESRLAEAEERSQAILRHISGIPGMKAEMMDNIIGHQPFGVHIEVDPEAGRPIRAGTCGQAESGRSADMDARPRGRGTYRHPRLRTVRGRGRHRGPAHRRGVRGITRRLDRTD